MIIKEVVFMDSSGREFRIPLNMEVNKNKILDIANDIISHLWLDDDESKPTAELIYDET